MKALALALLLTGCTSYNCAKDLTRPLSSCPLPPKRSINKCEIPVVDHSRREVYCTSRADIERMMRGF